MVGFPGRLVNLKWVPASPDFVDIFFSILYKFTESFEWVLICPVLNSTYTLFLSNYIITGKGEKPEEFVLKIVAFVRIIGHGNLASLLAILKS